jgi:(2S)-methylsuccinyl-CoA dehydrogenase
VLLVQDNEKTRRTTMTLAQLKTEGAILTAGPDLLLARAGEAFAAAERVLIAAKTGVRAKLAEAGGIDAAQHAAHGLAWLATTIEALRQMHGWASRLHGEGRFGEFEQLLLAAGFAEYLAQIAGGIPMSQSRSCGHRRWAFR